MNRPMECPKMPQGVVLITSLILLTMLTVLGITQISINSSQIQITANVADSTISFEKAEGALNEGINKMLNGIYSNALFINNATGLYQWNSSEAPEWQTVNWDSSNSVINSFSGTTNTNANYIIEQLPSVAQPGQNIKALTRIYRITSRAVGQNGLSTVLLQSTIEVQR